MEEALLLPELAEYLEKEKIIRLPEVMDVTGLRRSSIYQKIAENAFPMQIMLGAKAVGWREREIQKWIKDKIEKSQNKRER